VTTVSGETVPTVTAGVVTAEAVTAALRGVYDPCSLSMRTPTSVYDLGLVERIDIVGDQVAVELVLTDPTCMYAGDIRRHVADAVAAVPGVGGVDVRLSTRVFWSPARQARRQPLAGHHD
jgi:metal-sulfur cluster biosynthetic enzyme